MGDSTTTIDREQREGLYELVRNHLSRVEDFWVAMERTKDFARAEALGLELAQDLRLLQDIGWGEYMDRDSFALSMPTDELKALLQRLHREAVAILVGSGNSEARSLREDADTNRRFLVGYETCDRVLSEFDARGGQAA